MIPRRRFLTLVAAALCAPRAAHAATWQGRALGADVAVTLEGPRAAVEAMLAEVPALLDAAEAQFSLYRADSALSRLNRDGRLRLAPEMARLIALCDRAHGLTGGLFDPTVQPLWRALATGTPEAPARALIGWHRVRRDGGWLTLAPGQALTLNGIAQGFVTDLMRERLRAAGFDRALVNIGEHAALGGPFRLALADPVHGTLGQRSLTDGAIATSSPGALRLGPDGHILAPDGRAPLWSTISVEAPSAAMADALSTAAVFLARDTLAALRARAGLTRITAVTPAGDLVTL